VWLLHGALHPVSAIVFTLAIDAYSRLLPPSPLVPTCLLPLTSTIVTYSYQLAPAYFHHRCLLLPLSPIQVSHLLLRLLLPSPPSTIIAYSRLLPPLPPTRSCHCRLLSPTSTIATCMFSPLPPTPAYFHHRRLFRYLTCFYLLHHLLAYPCCWHV